MLAVYRAATSDLKLDYAQFEELEIFARFGARLGKDTRTIIAHSRRIRAYLKQPESAPVPVTEQVALLLALGPRLFDGDPLERQPMAEQGLRKLSRICQSSYGHAFGARKISMTRSVNW